MCELFAYIIVNNLLITILKNFLWGKVGKYQKFFVTLHPISEINEKLCERL